MSDSLRWCTTLLSSLYNRGVRHAIVSPGSRSTPLTLAAAIHPGIQKQVVLDERSAAFIALGIGKSTGIPSVLICTSGTAAANYMPAVVEAKESGVPIILLTADRPPKLRNLGSSQTVDQIKLFGDQAVFFHETGEPLNDETDLKRIAYAANQAVKCSIESGGVSHINLAFRKPLEPDTETFQKEKNCLEKQVLIKDYQAVINHSEIILDLKIQELIASAKQPLLIAGPSNPHQALSRQIIQFSDQLSAPVLSEPGSQLSNVKNQISRFDQFIRNSDMRGKLRPDLIIRFGDQPYSSSLLWALEAWKKTPVIHITARRQTQDHAMSVLYQVICNKHDSINIENIPQKNTDSWLNEWLSLDKNVSDTLNQTVSKKNELTDGSIFYHFAKELPGNWNMMLSNSLPVRDMLTFGQARKHQFVNRGAAGIDGILSTALGLHFSSDRPTCCFIGDLAFLHDSNALYTMQQVKNRPFVIIVVNNQGGNIFQMLPIYRNKKRSVPMEIYQAYFQTPQHVDISSLAKASGINHKKIDSLNALKNVNLNNTNGPMIIECVTNSQTSMDLRIDLLKG